MIIQDHSLINEFPAYKAQIEELNLTDNHFHSLYNQYHELDREVHRIEEGLDNACDEYLESQKLKRLQLKDELYARIRQVN